MTLDGALDLVAEARIAIPVVLFSYLNPIIAAGPDVLRRARTAGSARRARDRPAGGRRRGARKRGSARAARLRQARRADDAPRPDG
jgi:hypothetical protein